MFTLLFLINLFDPSFTILDGSLLSTSTAQSCATIQGRTDSNSNAGSSSTTQCDTATVMQIELSPDNQGGAVRFLFQNTGQSTYSGKGQPRCDNENPGTCVGSDPFYVVFNVTPILVSHALDLVNLEVPFAYARSTTITRSAAHSGSSKHGGPYPNVAVDTCGPTITYNMDDYTQCNQHVYFSQDGDNDKVSVCAFMSGIDLELEWEDDTGFCTRNESYFSLKEDFRRTNGNVPDEEFLTCKDFEFDSQFEQCMPNFPNPVSLCPCSGGSTQIKDNSNPSLSYDVAPITVCQSGTCVGTCGSAIAVEPGEWCGNTPYDECCNTTDTNNVCTNTGQLHRCLKAQPTGATNNKDHFCYYYDLNIQFRCSWYGKISNRVGGLDFNAYCGSCDYVTSGYFDPTYNQGDSPRIRDPRACDCDAYFVEKNYMVAPLCNTYVIRNPPRLEYTVETYFTDLDGNPIPGSLMTVGSGWGPDSTVEQVTTLPLSQYTPDGFALTRIVSADSPTGKKSSTLDGYVVVCDNGIHPSCGTNTENIEKANLPTANIQTSTPDGRTNPWAGDRFDDTEAKVTFSDQIFRFANELAQRLYNATTPTNATDTFNGLWHYYVEGRDTPKYGVGCGQIGWSPAGDTLASTAETICNGPIGTCVPGSDTTQFGEAIEPPCSVAADFYNYIVNYGGTYANQEDRQNGIGCRTPAPNLRKIPKHVPLDWDPIVPNYWLHRERYFKEDRSLNDLTIRIELSIAADFEGEIITQAPGEINAEPQDCTIYRDEGTGRVKVSVDNTGTQSAEYVLVANCTQGVIESPEGGVPFSQPPGIGGSDNVRTIPLTIFPDAILIPSQAQIDAGEIIPSCNVSLFPSGLIIQNHPLDTAVNIPCEVVFAYANVDPAQPIIHSSTINDVVEQSIGSTCKTIDPFCGWWWKGDSGLFPPFVHNLLIVFLILLIISLLVWAITVLISRATAEAVEAAAIESSINEQRTRTNALLWKAEKNI